MILVTVIPPQTVTEGIMVFFVAAIIIIIIFTIIAAVSVPLPLLLGVDDVEDAGDLQELGDEILGYFDTSSFHKLNDTCEAGKNWG